MPRGSPARGRGRGRGRSVSDNEPPRPGQLKSDEVGEQTVQLDEKPLLLAPPGRGRGRSCAEVRKLRPVNIGADQQQQQQPQQQEPVVKGATAVDEVTEKLSQITTSSSIGYTKREPEVHYPRRPGYGKAGRQINLRTNFFQLILPPNDYLFHYDVTIEPAALKSVQREIIKLVYEKYGGEAFGKAKPAYDGSKNLYTMKDLPVGKDGAKLNVVLPSTEGKRDRTFTVKIKFAARVYLKELKDFLAGEGAGSRPQESLMTLDVVLRHVPSFEFEAIGKGSFFPPNARSIGLGDGVELRFGFSQSVRHSEWNTVLVNVDVSAKAFYKQQPLVNYVCEVLNVGQQDLDNPNFFTQQRRFRQLKETLFGLRVQTNHLPNIKRKFIIGRIGSPANQSSFECDGAKVTIDQYMKERYNISLRYPNLPCIQKQGNNSMFPMEILDIVPCVRKKMTDEQTVKMIRQTARPAAERENDIAGWAKEMVEMNRVYLKQEFNMEMKSDLLDVQGRVLPTPVLGLGGQQKQLTPKDGSWDMRNKMFYSSVSIESWAIVVFMPEGRCRADAIRHFAKEFADTACSDGLRMPQEPAAVKYERPERVEEILCSLKTEYPKLQIIFCVLPDSRKALYGEIKRVGDNVIGVVTQCVQVKLVLQARSQVCSNIAMKVNAKLGGINHVICKDVQAPIFQEPVIVFGADVTHPPTGDNISPSIAAVVASIDLQASLYSSVVRAQASKKVRPSKKSETAEIIDNLDEIVKELLIRYYRNTKCKPNRILFYRDGVSEGQFEQVYMYELRAIQKACMSLPGNYRPKITLVVVQKRHHARFFCADQKDKSGKAGNIPAGTIVDRGVVHPYEFDFYLCSHFGIQGTSRPTHYHVLHDDNKFTADELQQITNELCYTFARCTRSVSIPSPAYYAHLVAFRARYHMHSEKFYSHGRKSKSQEEILRIVNNDIKVEEKHSHTMYFA